MTNLSDWQIVILMIMSLFLGAAIVLNTNFAIFYVRKKSGNQKVGNWHEERHKDLHHSLHELLSDYAGVKNIGSEDVLNETIQEVYQWSKINFKEIDHLNPHPVFRRKK